MKEKQGKNKAGVHRPIICKKCGHRVGFLKVNPVILDLIKKNKRKQTWVWIFIIALITQFISQVISDIILK